MTNQEIKDRIELLQERFCKTEFVYSKDNENIAHLIAELRSKCTHVNLNFEIQQNNGFCIYCGRQIPLWKN